MGKLIDLTGQYFKKLHVIGLAESTAHGKRKWVCECECGNICEVTTSNLTQGHTTSCGCVRLRDLTNMHIDNLTVLERSDKYTTRGNRKVRLWKCRCDCGSITYKATDTLTDKRKNSCKECAAKQAALTAKKCAGFVDGTQMSKIKSATASSNNTTGVRGVYLDKKTGKYRALIKFKGVRHHLGYFDDIEEAAKARRVAENEIFGAFLESHNETKSEEKVEKNAEY